MKVEIRELEIELIPETEHEKDAAVKLLKLRSVEVRGGKSSDRGWPPDPRKTNVVLILPDPNKW